MDFKTTTDASYESFKRTIWNMGYYRQAAYYLDIAKTNGLPHTDFVFVAVEKAPPYAVALYHMEDAAIATGRREYERLLALYEECLEKNEWPAYPKEPQLMGLPHWVGEAA